MICFYNGELGRFKSEGAKVFKFSKLHGTYQFDFNKPAGETLSQAVKNHYSEDYESDEVMPAREGALG